MIGIVAPVPLNDQPACITALECRAGIAKRGEFCGGKPYFSGGFTPGERGGCGYPCECVVDCSCTRTVAYGRGTPNGQGQGSVARHGGRRHWAGWGGQHCFDCCKTSQNYPCIRACGSSSRTRASQGCSIAATSSRPSRMPPGPLWGEIAGMARFVGLPPSPNGRCATVRNLLQIIHQPSDSDSVNTTMPA